jgi:hypothetical protein
MTYTDIGIVGGGLADSIAAAKLGAPGLRRSRSIRTRPIRSTSALKN